MPIASHQTPSADAPELVAPTSRAQTSLRLFWLTLGAVLFVHLLPRLLLGDRSIVTIHDNLDSDFIFRVLIAKPDRWLDYHAQIPELMGGIPRSVFPPATKLSSLWFWLLPPFWAYVCLEVCVHLLSFCGMYLLLRDHMPWRLSDGQTLIIAASFASLPYFVIFDGSVGGQALVAWALLNLWHERRRRASLLTLAAFPLVSVLPISGLFIIAGAGLCLVAGACVARRIPRWPLLGLVVLTCGYVVTDLWFIRSMLGGGYISHRSTWMQPGSTLSFTAATVMSRAGHTFLWGRYHSASVHTLILVASVITGLVALSRKQWRCAAWMGGVLLFTALVSVSHSIAAWRGLSPLWDAVTLTRMLNLRFHWSLPVLWFAALGVIAGMWSHVFQRPRWIEAFLVVNLAWIVAVPVEGYPELKQNYATLWSRARGEQPKAISYREFVAPRLFDQIARHIGQPKSSYRVISVGLHPSIAILNGFYTADGYHDNYPLSYKLRFRKLIAGELALDKKQRKYFDDWGNRVYVLQAKKRNSALDLRQTGRKLVLNRLSLDPAALVDLHVNYVFSAYQLTPKAQNGFLHFEGAFDDAESAWRVYLYKVELLTAQGTSSIPNISERR